MIKHIAAVASEASSQQVEYTDNKQINQLLNDVRAMPLLKIKSLIKALNGLQDFLDGDGFKAFDGKMEVKAATDAELVLGMNLMRWLTKFYFPDVVSGFTTLYRLHAIPKVDIKVGSMYKFKPRKPMLSWTVLEKPEVADREQTVAVADYVISSKFPKSAVIWSFKIMEHKTALRQAARDYNHVINFGPLKSRDDSDEATATMDFITELYLAANNMLKAEREVVVFNDMKPFTAKVIRKV